MNKNTGGRLAQETIELTENKRISGSYFRLRAACGVHYAKAAAGQFVTLRLLDQTEPLLRRPFSIHQVNIGSNGIPEIEILYRVVGGFTSKLSRQPAGSRLDLLGPLGHGFTVTAHTRPAAVVAGGIGVAPLVFLVWQLKLAGMDPDLITVFLGGQTRSDILCRDRFEHMGVRTKNTTEDGSLGFHGLVTTSLETWLKTADPAMIYACGPHGMLMAVGKIARSANTACELSIETLMACGLGVCMGCAVKTRSSGEGFEHVCKHGPVFDAAALV
ncbi:MAG: dihydroorotate dehydrogenase electron transfer subunit [Desulfosalsimonas sp.]|uniref:dihydroorotate dehydrogenase electron transfer subunit n=1 Tax=Desulfosalsimonas sp. TaxID=3073848 RepID=UPI0039705D01